MENRTFFYCDPNGEYLGGFSEGNESIPENAIQIDEPPPHGWQKRDMIGGGWLPLTDLQKTILGIE